MRYMARTTIRTCVLLFAAGVVAGTLKFAQRSSVVERHVPGANAVPVHIALALFAVAIAIGLAEDLVRQTSPLLDVGPPPSRDRPSIASNDGPGAFRPPLLEIVRAVVAACLSILLLYHFFRAGQQLIGGLDPNFTVNAWGGPSYLGAMLAHYLDAVYLFYIEAFLLHLVLVERTRYTADRARSPPGALGAWGQCATLCYMEERRVGVRELRQNLSKYLRRVERGERLEVTEHGRPCAVLGPLGEPQSPLARLVAAGRATPTLQGPARVAPSEGPIVDRTSDALLEERVERL